jgi:glutamyl-tRNA reductase
VGQLCVISRNLQRAQALAERLGGVARPFHQLEEALAAADFVLTATGASEHILTQSQMGRIMAQRPQRPLLVVDNAVPRDVESSVGALEGVSLLNMDDVQSFAERNLALRAQETDKAEAIVEAEVGKFQKWWRTQEVVPTITALRSKAEAIRQREVHKTLRRLPALSEAERGQVEAMSKAIVKQLLHPPLMYLKERHDEEASVEAVHALFGLTDDAPPHRAGLSPQDG